jgi:NAD(P)-dependent dehydrogenase (short-subunit alcohol dehydrogenase family)
MKYVVVTGVSTGIGYATVAEFVKNGYHVFGSVRKQADADQLKIDFGEAFTPLMFDVVDQDAIDLAARKVEKAVGEHGLRALVNNAGMAVGGPLMHIPLEEFRHQLEVNVVGLLGVTQAFLPLLGARKDCPHAPGKVINISSVGGQVPMAFIGPYTASKHAVESLTTSLRQELLMYGIDVIAVQPGAVATPIWKKGPRPGNNGFEHTDYGVAFDAFLNAFVEEGKKGLNPTVLGKKIRKLVEKNKARVNNFISPTPFVDKFLFRYLPARWLDKMLGKEFKLNQLPEKVKEEVYSLKPQNRKM